MNIFRNWWIRFSMKYLGYTYYVDTSNLPPPAQVFTFGHSWSQLGEITREYSITGCECGAKIRSVYKTRGGPVPETASAVQPCPFAEKHEQERLARG